MSTGSMVKTIVGLFTLILFLMVAGAYGAGILSSQSHAVNVTGTSYQSTYDSNTQIDSSLFVVFGPICFILFFGIVLMAFRTLKSRR